MNNKIRWIVVAVDFTVCCLNGVIAAVSMCNNIPMFPINIFMSGMFFSGCIYELALIFMQKQKNKYKEHIAKIKAQVKAEIEAEEELEEEMLNPHSV